jgi:hypothetical protein
LPFGAFGLHSSFFSVFFVCFCSVFFKSSDTNKEVFPGAFRLLLAALDALELKKMAHGRRA